MSPSAAATATQASRMVADLVSAIIATARASDSMPVTRRTRPDREFDSEHDQSTQGGHGEQAGRPDDSLNAVADQQ